jgi:flagellar protein FliO/FliZ
MSPLPSRALTTAAYAAATFFLTAPAALAAKAVPPQPSHGEDRPLDLPLDAPRQVDAAGSSGGGLVRTFVGLAVVVAVIYGLYWVLRQVKSSREERASGRGLATQAVVPLGPGRSLHLVRAGRELVMVGVAEHGVTPIRTYSEQEAEALGLTADDDDGDGPVAGGPTTIGDLLDRVRTWTVRP